MHLPLAEVYGMYPEIFAREDLDSSLTIEWPTSDDSDGGDVENEAHSDVDTS